MNCLFPFLLCFKVKKNRTSVDVDEFVGLENDPTSKQEIEIISGTEEYDFRFESHRLKSFGSPREWNGSVSIYELSKSGFHSTGIDKSTTVTCAFCKLRVDRWFEGDDANVVHKSLNPRCALMNMNDISVGNISIGEEEFTAGIWQCRKNCRTCNSNIGRPFSDKPQKTLRDKKNIKGMDGQVHAQNAIDMITSEFNGNIGRNREMIHSPIGNISRDENAVKHEPVTINGIDRVEHWNFHESQLLHSTGLTRRSVHDSSSLLHHSDIGTVLMEMDGKETNDDDDDVSLRFPFFTVGVLTHNPDYVTLQSRIRSFEKYIFSIPKDLLLGATREGYYYPGTGNLGFCFECGSSVDLRESFERNIKMKNKNSNHNKRISNDVVDVREEFGLHEPVDAQKIELKQVLTDVFDFRGQHSRLNEKCEFLLYLKTFQHRGYVSSSSTPTSVRKSLTSGCSLDSCPCCPCCCCCCCSSTSLSSCCRYDEEKYIYPMDCWRSGVSSVTSKPKSETVCECVERIDSNDLELCRLCFLAKINILLFPCHHAMCCELCASLLKNCVYCQETIVAFMVFYY